MKQKYLAVLIVIVCTVLLQAHSIPFWLEQTDGLIGYLWSFSIEFVAIWLWLNKKMVMATVASLIIIFVPLIELSKPLLSEIRERSINVKISELNELDIKQSELLQSKYIDTDWAGTLIKNSDYFRKAIDVQKELLFEDKNLKSNLENILIIILQSIALIIILLAQIQALRMLAFRDFEKVEINSFGNYEISETPETKAEKLLKQIENYIEEKNITQSSFANEIGIPSSVISKLRNRVFGNGEPISDKKLHYLRTVFQRLKQ